MPHATPFTIAVNPKIPQRLARLEELANDLWYSWDRSTRSLFSRLHQDFGALSVTTPRLSLNGWMNPCC